LLCGGIRASRRSSVIARAWAEHEEVFQSDPWECGLTERNRRNLQTLVGYSFEQGLIKRKLSARGALFVDVSQGRRRGEEFTF
jgi:4,5-dihydroxyphthalate decarboxylase